MDLNTVACVASGMRGSTEYELPAQPVIRIGHGKDTLELGRGRLPCHLAQGEDRAADGRITFFQGLVHRIR